MRAAQCESQEKLALIQKNLYIQIFAFSFHLLLVTCCLILSLSISHGKPFHVTQITHISISEIEDKHMLT